MRHIILFYTLPHDDVEMTLHHAREIEPLDWEMIYRLVDKIALP